MFQALFWKNSRFSHFGQKLSKMGHFGPKCPKMEVFRIFLGIPSLLFSETLQLIRAFNSEKMFQTLFWKKSRFAHFGQKVSKIGHLAGCVGGVPLKSWKSLKNLKVGVFETDFKQVPFLFRQTTCTYSESWLPVENFFDPHPLPPWWGVKMAQTKF